MGQYFLSSKGNRIELTFRLRYSLTRDADSDSMSVILVTKVGHQIELCLCVSGTKSRHWQPDALHYQTPFCSVNKSHIISW